MILIKTFDWYNLNWFSYCWNAGASSPIILWA